METLITVKDLCKTYKTGKQENTVLNGVCFEMQAGEFVSVMGPSGSGKSTLLYTVSGMDTVTSGTVSFRGRELSGMQQKELAQIRLKEMGFIFQQMYMMKKLCIFDNIVLPAYQAGAVRAEANSRAEQLMQRLGISETAKHEVTEVSGGELQRACLCRALINEPQILFADEPTGALNSKAAADVMRELVNVWRAGTGILMVTHSVRVAAMSERVLYLMDGTVQGEIRLGRLEEDADTAGREQRLSAWLMERGW